MHRKIKDLGPTPSTLLFPLGLVRQHPVSFGNGDERFCGLRVRRLVRVVQQAEPPVLGLDLRQRRVAVRQLQAKERVGRHPMRTS